MKHHSPKKLCKRALFYVNWHRYDAIILNYVKGQSCFHEMLMIILISFTVCKMINDYCTFTLKLGELVGYKFIIKGDMIDARSEDVIRLHGETAR